MWKVLFIVGAFVTLVISRPQGPPELPEPVVFLLLFFLTNNKKRILVDRLIKLIINNFTV